MTNEPAHNHIPDEAGVQRGLLLKRLKSQVGHNPSMPVRRVYDKCANAASVDDFVPQFGNVRTRIKRFRASYIPPIPQTIDDVNFQGSWCTTWKGDRFLRHVDNDWGIAVFATKAMLNSLQSAECLYIDGTFRTTPRPYKQLITVHGLLHGFVLPLGFCLATGKTIGHYRQLMQCLKCAVMRLFRRNLQPRKAIIDFEASLMIAVETELPLAAISCCYFHFNQSLWRHVQHLGLVNDYRQDYNIRKVIRLVMAIGFLPVLLVLQNFRLITARRSVRRLIRRQPQLGTWLEYAERTYVIPNSQFPPPVWNVYSRDINTRTNN